MSGLRDWENFWWDYWDSETLLGLGSSYEAYLAVHEAGDKLKQPQDLQESVIAAQTTGAWLPLTFDGFFRRVSSAFNKISKLRKYQMEYWIAD